MALLEVPIHLQDNYQACGPACAQMVLRFLTGQLIAQPLAPNAGVAGAAWYTDPEQLRAMLSPYWMAPNPPYTIRVNKPFDAAMAHVTGALNKGLPAIVLASGGEHWTVVRGISGSGGNRFVHVRDPQPPRDNLPRMPVPLPPHADADVCDEGDQLGGAQGNAEGFSDEVVAWSDWKSDYFTTCRFGGAPWRGKRVVLAPDVESVPLPEPIALPVTLPQPLTELTAGDWAVQQLEQSGLLSLPAWSDARKWIPKQPRAIRVERIDGQPSYFLVALCDDVGRGVLAGIGAEEGQLLWARTRPGRAATQLLVVQEAAHRRFVWQPSAASFFSPYYPFSEHQLPTGGVAYQRLYDRAVFHDLTPRTDRPD